MPFRWAEAAQGAQDKLQQALADRYAKTQEAQRVARELARDAENQRRYETSLAMTREGNALAAMEAAAQRTRQTEQDRIAAEDRTRVANERDFAKRQETNAREVQRKIIGGVRSRQLKPTEAGFAAAEEGVELPAFITHPPQTDEEKLKFREEELKLGLKYRPPTQGPAPTFHTLVDPNGKQRRVAEGQVNSYLDSGWQLYDQVQARQQATLKASGAGKQNKQADYISGALDMAEKLKSMPGKKGAVGAKGPMSLFGLFDEPFGGTDAADYVSVFKTLQSRLTVPELQKLAGTGPVSDREFATLAAGAAALDRAMKEGTWDTALDELIRDMKEKYRLASGAEWTPPTPVAPSGGTRRGGGARGPVDAIDRELDAILNEGR